MKNFKEFITEGLYRDNGQVDHRSHGEQGLVHRSFVQGMKKGMDIDYYEHGTGDKKYGQIHKLTDRELHVKRHREDGKPHKEIEKFKIVGVS